MARYAVVDRETKKVVNVIEWDGKSDISFLTKKYDIVQAHDPNTGEYIGDKGDYYDSDRKEFLRPIAIKVNKQVVFKGKVRLKELRDVIAKHRVGRAPTDVIEVVYWEDAEKEGA